MKKKNWKRRTFVTLFLIPLIALLIYQAAGCPAFSAEQAFRRLEAQHVLGSGTILGSERIDCNDYGRKYDTLIIAETKYGAMLYCCDLNKDEQLYYRKKAGPLTVMALPNGGLSWIKNAPRQLNIVLFDDYPEAVRAELEINIDWAHDFHGFTPGGIHENYQLSAQRHFDGYFHFIHTIYGSDYIDAANVAMRILTDITCKGYVAEEYHLQLEIPILVRLYDSEGNLITEESISLRSIAVEEHEKHNNG